ncbi:hypothetical protein, partial [Klebsiella pneumoniae]|uniref:hypothetical protein n=1 Tax=Klebsiella pneumoniae TaxID=573 RepID=UPI00300B6351
NFNNIFQKKVNFSGVGLRLNFALIYKHRNRLCLYPKGYKRGPINGENKKDNTLKKLIKKSPSGLVFSSSF